MKKTLTLIFALILAFALTVPAMAFTSDSTDDDEDYPYELKIYLVEYDDNDLFGFVSLPESDRGYAKNEIVGAIVQSYVPDDEDPYDDDFTSLEITGDNVDFDVTDDAIAGDDSPALTRMTDNSDGYYYDLVNNVLTDDTFQWLVFAKVTDDDASLTAKLIAGTSADEFSGDEDTISVTLNGTLYTIAKSYDEDDGGSYTITDEDGNQVIIYVDEDYESDGMAIYSADLDHTFDLGVNTKNELGIVDGATIDTDSDDYEDVMDLYEDIAVDDFGLDYFLIGNYVRDSFFEDLVSADTITATVDIEPWTAYVTVPDAVVVDPPKTGDAASIMGFVMVALAGSGVVALRKRG